MSSVNEILETHALSGSKLTARTFVELPEDDNNDPPEQFLLIEGSRESLKFLADLILAQLNSDYGCNLHLHPNSAGSNHFSPRSTAGIYIHRIPCDLHPDNVVS